MTTIIPQDVDIAPVQFPDGFDPVTMYLNTLSPTAQSTMRFALLAVLKIIMQTKDVRLAEIYSFPWHMLKLPVILKIRSVLMQDYAHSTANLYLAGLRGVIKACWRLELISVEEMNRRLDFEWVVGVTLPKGRSLEAAELTKLLDACEAAGGAGGVRDKALISFMVATGARREETVSVFLEDLVPHNDGYELILAKGKGNKDRWLFINSRAREIVDQWIAVRGVAPGPLFVRVDWLPQLEPISGQTIMDVLKRRCLAAGIHYVKPHDLRKTFITSLLLNGVDIFLVQQLAGHALSETTRRYDLRGKEELEKAAHTLANMF